MLTFAIAGMRAIEHAGAPSLGVTLAIEASAPTHATTLHAQILIEPAARIAELGLPRSIVWTHAALALPAFARRTTAELVLPCPIDGTQAAAKYFDGVADVVPIVVQLSGTVFHGDPKQVAMIPRDRECRGAVPVALWRAALGHYFAGAMRRARQERT